jgi:hypothetical protein
VGETFAAIASIARGDGFRPVRAALNSPDHDRKRHRGADALSPDPSAREVFCPESRRDVAAARSGGERRAMTDCGTSPEPD